MGVREGVQPGLEGEIETNLLLSQEFSGSNIHNGFYLPAELLEKALKLAVVNGIDIHKIISVEDLNDLKKVVYTKGIEALLIDITAEMTRDSQINNSSLDRCRQVITLAEDYAKKIDYSEVNDKIVDRLLESAKFYGLQEGKEILYRFCLKEAKKYALKKGINVVNRISNLESELSSRN